MGDTLLTIAIAITLWGSVGGMALVHQPSALLEPYRRTRLLARVAAFDLLVIPPVTWAVTVLLGVPEGFAIGVILVGATAAGPLGVTAVQLARGDGVLALALVSFLEVANALAVPAWAAVLLPRSAAVPLAPVAAVLIGYVLAPIAVGTLLRRRAPTVADRLVPIARVVAAVGLAVVILLVVTSNLPVFGMAAAGGVPLATVLVIAFALAGGWLVGGPDRHTRLAVALVSAQRGSSIALAIALTAYGDVPEARVAVVVFGMISIVVVPAIGLLARGRSAPLGVPLTA